MPWIAHPFTPKVLQEIGDRYGVSKVPTLLVMNSDGTVAIEDGKIGNQLSVYDPTKNEGQLMTFQRGDQVTNLSNHNP